MSIASYQRVHVNAYRVGLALNAFRYAAMRHVFVGENEFREELMQAESRLCESLQQLLSVSQHSQFMNATQDVRLDVLKAGGDAPPSRLLKLIGQWQHEEPDPPEASFSEQAAELLRSIHREIHEAYLAPIETAIDECMRHASNGDQAWADSLQLGQEVDRLLRPTESHLGLFSVVFVTGKPGDISGGRVVLELAETWPLGARPFRATDADNRVENFRMQVRAAEKQLRKIEQVRARNKKSEASVTPKIQPLPPLPQLRVGRSPDDSSWCHDGVLFTDLVLSSGEEPTFEPDLGAGFIRANTTVNVIGSFSDLGEAALTVASWQQVASKKGDGTRVLHLQMTHAGWFGRVREPTSPTVDRVRSLMSVVGRNLPSDELESCDVESGTLIEASVFVRRLTEALEFWGRFDPTATFEFDVATGDLRLGEVMVFAGITKKSKRRIALASTVSGKTLLDCFNDLPVKPVAERVQNKEARTLFGSLEEIEVVVEELPEEDAAKQRKADGVTKFQRRFRMRLSARTVNLFKVIGSETDQSSSQASCAEEPHN